MTFPIHLDHVTRALGRDFALRDLTLRVPQGAIYGLLGPNGCGKTTTIRLIMGMLAPDRGSVTLRGHRMPDAAEAALAGVGFVPERMHLYPGLTVQEMAAYHASFHSRWDRETAQRLMGDFGLRPDAIIGALSKGEGAKLMMLLALATRPEVLVLDEPTDGLDPVARRDVLAALMDYVAVTGCTVLMTSHLIHEVERTCDWIGLMDRGAMVTEAPLTELRASLRRLRIVGAPRDTVPHALDLISRRPVGRAEEWVVRGEEAATRERMASLGAEVVDTAPLDLEETVVELLRSAREPLTAGVS